MREIVIVRNPSDSRSHRLDARYAVLGRALCGVAVRRKRYDAPLDRSVDCKKCRTLAGEGS